MAVVGWVCVSGSFVSLVFVLSIFFRETRRTPNQLTSKTLTRLFIWFCVYLLLAVLGAILS